MRPFNYKYIPDVPSGMLDSSAYLLNTLDSRLNKLHRVANRKFHAIDCFNFLLNQGDKEDDMNLNNEVMDDEC